MSVAVLGEALIDLIAGKDGAYRPHLGGSPYNVAIGLARQGIPVSYLSPLSDDSFGDQLHASLLAEGVDLPIRRRSLWPTSLALVTTDERGFPTYRLYREGIADKDSTFEEIKRSLPERLKLFHTGSLAITPSQLPKIRDVLTFLRERGVVISIDINIRLRASIDSRRYLDGVRSLIPFVDILKASDEDLASFDLGADPRVSAEIVLDEMNDGIVLLTEGDGGAVLFSRHGKIEKRAYPVARVEDTIGAGDTFHAAFLSMLCRAENLVELISNPDVDILGNAVDIACAAAAINVSRAGCSPPTYDEVTRFVGATQRK